MKLVSNKNIEQTMSADLVDSSKSVFYLLGGMYEF